MATCSITVHVLGGAEIVILQDPGELVESLRLKVEDRIGGLGELQEVKLLTEAGDLCYDAIIAECLQPQSIVQAVVTVSVQRAKGVIQKHPFFKAISNGEVRYKQPPPLLRDAKILPFRQSALQFSISKPSPLDFAHALDALATMDQNEYISNLTDEFAQFTYHIMDRSHHDLPLLIRLWSWSGCHPKLIPRIKYGLRRCQEDHWSVRIVDDEGNGWMQLVASLNPCGQEAIAGLCFLASNHVLHEVRAAAISVLGSAPVLSQSLVLQLQHISNAEHGDPAEMVREAAAAAVRVQQLKAPPAPPIVRPALVQLMPPPAQHGVQQLTQSQAKAAGRAIAKAPAGVKASLPVRPSFGEAEMEPNFPAAARAKAPARPSFSEAETEPDFLEALQQSENEALQLEQQHVQEALLRSKQDISQGIATLFRLTFHNPQVISFILNFPALAGSRSRVESAGCCVQPPWANGALVLVPATEEQVEEAGIVLRAHNILLLDCDKVFLEQCLAQISRRKRPQLKLEQYPGGLHAVSKTEPTSHVENEYAFGEAHEDTLSPKDWLQDAGLVVERTFLSFPVDKEISDASGIVHSAPAVPQVTSRSLNPHRWRLPSPKISEGASGERIGRKLPEST